MSQEKKAVQAFRTGFRQQSTYSSPSRLICSTRLRDSVFGHNKTFILALVLAVLLLFTMNGLLLHTSPVPSASAVTAEANIGVYSDHGCTQNVSSINWGTLTPGETKNDVVYVKNENEGNETIILNLTTLNWQPNNAILLLNFSWSCRNNTIEPGQVVEVTQTLSVAASIPSGFSGFSFNIVFGGDINGQATPTPHLLGDINGDGVVDLHDLAILAAAYGSHRANYDYQGEPASPNWNPLADLNGDGVVNLQDYEILVSEYGQTSG